MMACARRTSIVADHGKFGLRALKLYGSWGRGVELVSDQGPPSRSPPRSPVRARASSSPGRRRRPARGERSGERLAAISDERVAGHEGRAVRGEEEDRLGDLPGTRPAAEGDLSRL